MSKQFLAVAVAHVSGLVWSHVLSGADASECAYYIVVFVLDTTLGVAASLVLHRTVCDVCARAVAVATQPAAEGAQPPCGGLLRRVAPLLARSGDYGCPVSVRVWCAQAASWCACVLLGARPTCDSDAPLRFSR